MQFLPRPLLQPDGGRSITWADSAVGLDQPEHAGERHRRASGTHFQLCEPCRCGRSRLRPELNRYGIGPLGGAYPVDFLNKRQTKMNRWHHQDRGVVEFELQTGGQPVCSFFCCANSCSARFKCRSSSTWSARTAGSSETLVSLVFGRPPTASKSARLSARSNTNTASRGVGSRLRLSRRHSVQKHVNKLSACCASREWRLRTISSISASCG